MKHKDAIFEFFIPPSYLDLFTSQLEKDTQFQAEQQEGKKLNQGATMNIFNKYPINNFVSKLVFLCKSKKLWQYCM